MGGSLTCLDDERRYETGVVEEATHLPTTHKNNQHTYIQDGEKTSVRENSIILASLYFIYHEDSRTCVVTAPCLLEMGTYP